jgi:hypothetical protein
MTKRKADRAIVVVQDRRRLAGYRVRQDGGSATPRNQKWVMVPSEQRGLEEDRKNADKRNAAPPYGRSRLPGPTP